MQGNANKHKVIAKRCGDSHAGVASERRGGGDRGRVIFAACLGRRPSK